MTTEIQDPAPPRLDGVLDVDRETLAEHTGRAEERLAALPPRPERGPSERKEADEIHHSCRWARTRFLRLHAGRVYGELTEGGTWHPRLDELVYAAAESFPGLVPTRAQIAEENRSPQAAKEGREVDQGIFFHAVLGDPESGTHLMDAMRRPTARARDLTARFRDMGALDLGRVRIERRARTAVLTMSNKDVLNAEDNALTEDLETAVDLALLDGDATVCVLRGDVMDHPRHRGRRVFSAGINLTRLNQGGISFVDFLLRRELGFIAKIARGLVPDETPAAWAGEPLEKPWIAAVESFAIGGGAQITMVFDRIIAAADAYFSLPAAQEGIVPGAANLRLGRLSPGRLPQDMLLAGRKVWAAEPDGRLLCDQVVDPGEMDAAIESAARDLDARAVIANRRMLRLAMEPPDRFREYMAEFALTQALRLYDEDVIEKGDRWRARAAAPRAGTASP